MNDRTSEIQAALDAVPAPPWRWIGTRTSGGPQLVTDHSGRQYLLRAAKPTDGRGDELLDPEGDYPIYGDLQFRDQRPGEKYSTMRRGDELAIGRTSYDENSIVDVDNPVAQFLRHAPQYVADLLAENARLRSELEPYEVLNPQQCPKGLHADWLVDSEHAHACPWCEVEKLRQENAELERALGLNEEAAA